MKRYRSLMLCLIILAPAVACADTWVAPECDDCSLQTPVPDALTLKALDDYGKPAPGHETPVSYNVRDDVTICGRCQCTTYTVTSDHKYVSKMLMSTRSGRTDSGTTGSASG